jgi:hypothetical protein
MRVGVPRFIGHVDLTLSRRSRGSGIRRLGRCELLDLRASTRQLDHLATDLRAVLTWHLGSPPAAAFQSHDSTFRSDQRGPVNAEARPLRCRPVGLREDLAEVRFDGLEAEKQLARRSRGCCGRRRPRARRVARPPSAPPARGVVVAGVGRRRRQLDVSPAATAAASWRSAKSSASRMTGTARAHTRTWSSLGSPTALSVASAGVRDRRGEKRRRNPASTSCSVTGFSSSVWRLRDGAEA